MVGWWGCSCKIEIGPVTMAVRWFAGVDWTALWIMASSFVASSFGDVTISEMMKAQYTELPYPYIRNHYYSI